MDRSEYNLARPKSSKSFTRTTSQDELIVAKIGDLDDGGTHATIEIDGDHAVTGGRSSKSSHKDGHQTIQITTKSETIAMSRSSSRAAGGTAGRDSAGGTEDLSSEDLREAGEDGRSPMKKVSSRKTKEHGRKHRKHKSGARGDMLSPSYGGYSSGSGRNSQQSAFPISTPDRLGPLSDLLEEEIVLPGESRDTSASVDGRGGSVQKDKSDGHGGNKGNSQPNWAYLPPPRSPTTSTTSSESYVVQFFYSI